MLDILTVPVSTDSSSMSCVPAFMSFPSTPLDTVLSITGLEPDSDRRGECMLSVSEDKEGLSLTGECFSDINLK